MKAKEYHAYLQKQRSRTMKLHRLVMSQCNVHKGPTNTAQDNIWFLENSKY